jgi:hypothetical protein
LLLAAEHDIELVGYTGLAHLLYVLRSIPGLHFVGGSIWRSADNILRTPCLQPSRCQYTFQQDFGYGFSLGNTMACDEVGPSFLARTDQLKRVGFDPALDLLSTTDFFFRAKESGMATGLLPEALFNSTEPAPPIEWTSGLHGPEKIDSGPPTAWLDQLLPFAIKYRVLVLRLDQHDRRRIDMCPVNRASVTGPRRVICVEEQAHQTLLGGTHYAYAGAYTYPYVINELQRGLILVSEALDAAAIPFYVHYGLALGAIKMRQILPWDAGDVDMVFDGSTSTDRVLELLTKSLPEGCTVKLQNSAIAVFTTPADVGELMGGVLTLVPDTVRSDYGQKSDEKVAAGTFRMKVGDRYYPFQRSVFNDVANIYGAPAGINVLNGWRRIQLYVLAGVGNARAGIGFLQHKSWSIHNFECTAPPQARHACLPNFQALSGSIGAPVGITQQLLCKP